MNRLICHIKGALSISGDVFCVWWHLFTYIRYYGTAKYTQKGIDNSELIKCSNNDKVTCICWWLKFRVYIKCVYNVGNQWQYQLTAAALVSPTTPDLVAL